MIQIVVSLDTEQRIAQLLVEGHAGFSDSEHGGDIVCSAVSALVGFLGIAFSEVHKGRVEVSADDGLFRLRVLESDSVVQVLLTTWIRSVEQLEENYQGWVKVVRQI